MSLYRRLIFAITLLLSCLLAANLIVTVYNARANIDKQLQVHAQDTATSLGFSITQAALAKDTVQVSSMVDVIFDRGYYRQIIYRDLDGNDIVRRELPLVVEQVPQWFTQWLRLSEPSGDALVSSGWYQLGEIIVVSHPGFAYQDLWRSFREQLWLFLFILVLSYGLLGIGLKYILKPLHQVESQAEAICRREFPVQQNLPAIPELQRVVIAMNRMVEKVKTMFGHQLELNDHLYQQLRTDDVTGLSNRRDFDERLVAYLKSERTADEGALLLMQIGDLQVINYQQGREEGDHYLEVIAQYLKNFLKHYPDGLCSRHSGADFAIYLPAISAKESQEVMEKMYGELQSLEWSGEKIQPIFIGAVYLSQASEQFQQRSYLLSAADNALNVARNEQPGGCYWQTLDASSASPLSASQWSEILQQVFDERSFHYHFQPVWQIIHGQKSLLFNELLTHITWQKTDFSASAFLPMATRLQLMSTLDRLVLENIFDHPDRLPEKLCVNLSIATLEDKLFLAMLQRRLADQPNVASRLVFELPASSLSYAESIVREFAALVKKLGAQLSLHHFGRGNAEFAFLQTLPLDYLKIDRCFIQSITEDSDAQFFVRSLVAIAQSCDLTVLAEGVENEAQWQQLIQLGIQGGQGYWLGKPQVEPVVG